MRFWTRTVTRRHVCHRAERICQLSGTRRLLPRVRCWQNKVLWYYLVLLFCKDFFCYFHLVQSEDTFISRGGNVFVHFVEAKETQGLVKPQVEDIPKPKLSGLPSMSSVVSAKYLTTKTDVASCRAKLRLQFLVTTITF